MASAASDYRGAKFCMCVLIIRSMYVATPIRHARVIRNICVVPIQTEMSLYYDIMEGQDDMLIAIC